MKTTNKNWKEELQKLLEEHFELKELKDWDWRLGEIEDFISKALAEQREEMIKIIERRPVLHHELDENLIVKDKLLEIIKEL